MTRIFTLEFDNEHGPSVCRAAVILAPTGALQIAFMELNENHGLSVTHSWPALAKSFLAARFPTLNLGDVEWFEVYPYLLEGRENVSRVILPQHGAAHRFEYEQDATVRSRIWKALQIDLAGDDVNAPSERPTR